MTHDEHLAKAAWLLSEFQCDAHALPLRLRVLNMFTYTLDTLFMQSLPPLIANATRDRDAAATVRAIADESVRMLDSATETLRSEIRPILTEYGMNTVPLDQCSREQQAWIADYFARKVRPLLTPLAVDAGRPFPQISAHSLNLLAVIERGSTFDLLMPSFARLKVPRLVPRLIEVGGEPDVVRRERLLVLSEDVVRSHVQAIFPGLQVSGVYQFRILRGTALETQMPVGRHTALARQKAWPVVRIDVETDMPEWVVRWLQENLEAQSAIVLRRQAPLGMGTLAAEWAERLPLLMM